MCIFMWSVVNTRMGQAAGGTSLGLATSCKPLSAVRGQHKLPPPSTFQLTPTLQIGCCATQTVKWNRRLAALASAQTPVLTAIGQRISRFA